MKKKLISLISLLIVLMFVMPSVVFAIEGLGDISADDEVSLVETEGPPGAIEVEGIVPSLDPVVDIPLEDLDPFEIFTVNVDDLFEMAVTRMTAVIASGEFASEFAMNDIEADLMTNDTSSNDYDEVFLAHVLAQLRMVDLDPTGESPKPAVLYGTQTVVGWDESPSGSGNWYYHNADGSIYDDGWLSLVEGGVMWHYYLQPDKGGLMAKGLLLITSENDGRDYFYYFCTTSGHMAHAWYHLQLEEFDDDKKYYRYFGYPGAPNSGAMQVTAWIEDTANSPVYWYYLGSYGRMYSYQWLLYGGHWYYFVGSGHMVADTIMTIDSQLYHFNEDGEMSIGWFEYNNNIYHATSSGALSRGAVALSEYAVYVFGSDGKLQSDEVVEGITYKKVKNSFGEPITPEWVLRGTQRWGGDNLICENGKRYPRLTIAATDAFNTKWPNGMSYVLDFFEDEALAGKVELVQANSADETNILLDWDELYAPYGSAAYVNARTYTRNKENEWGFSVPYQSAESDGTFYDGIITYALIVMNSSLADDAHLAQHPEKYMPVLCHEIMHAIGVRHPYETTEEGYDNPIDIDKSLMWPSVDNNHFSTSLESYEIEELAILYPE